jgi:homoserine dehydrogenase
MHVRIAFAGFGNVARAFARILNEHQSRLAEDYGLRCKTVGIATARHGCVTSADGIDLLQAVDRVERGNQLIEVPGSLHAEDPPAMINDCSAQVLFETTPLNLNAGEPATTYIRSALARGMHVVTANKGPIAFAYRQLKALADGNRLSFRFEGSVMDGAPVFNLVERCLPGVRVLGFSGVLNSTTNIILTGMESGRSFEESLVQAQRLGIAEANADYDIDGWDATVKAVALANVLMGADLRPPDVARTGIRGVTIEDLRSAADTGATIRLVARGRLGSGGPQLIVEPERLSLGSTLGAVRGTSNALVLETDLMGEIAICENEPGVRQTAYALMSDLLTIYNDGPELCV